jgi:hypothetical protein
MLSPTSSPAQERPSPAELGAPDAAALPDILADIRTGRLQWLHIRDESMAQLIPALADLPASSRMRLAVMVGDEQELRPVLAAVAPIVHTLLLAEPRRVRVAGEERRGFRPRMASFPFMPRLECLVCQPAGEYNQRAQRITGELLAPHAATLRHVVLRQLPDYQDVRYLSRLGAALRSMPRLESLAICPFGLKRMYVVPVARFAIFGGPAQDYEDTYRPTCPLLPLPASLTAISLSLVKDFGRNGTARFLPDPEDLPRTIRRVCFFKSDVLTREEVRGAVARLFEALPAVESVEDHTAMKSYEQRERGGGEDGLVVRSVRERPFHDYGPGTMPSADELCAEIEGRPGGWNELAISPCVSMRQIAYGEMLGPEDIVYSRLDNGDLVRVRQGNEPEPEPEPPLPPPLRLVNCTDVLSPLAEAARRCAGILRFVVCPGLHPIHERGAAAVASILADHPEMRELTFQCSSISDGASDLIAEAIRAHPHLRIVRAQLAPSKPPAPWKRTLMRTVLETNAGRRRCDLDRAAWKVVMAGVRRGMEMVADGWMRPAQRHALPWHMHSISGRIADFLGNPEPEQLAFVCEDWAFDDVGWMLWFLPERSIA